MDEAGTPRAGGARVNRAGRGRTGPARGGTHRINNALVIWRVCCFVFPKQATVHFRSARLRFQSMAAKNQQKRALRPASVRALHRHRMRREGTPPLSLRFPKRFSAAASARPRSPAPCSGHASPAPAMRPFRRLFGSFAKKSRRPSDFSRALAALAVFSRHLI